MKKELTLDVVCTFVKEAHCDFINSNAEIIIEHDKNIFFSTKGLQTAEELDAAYLLAIARPLSMSNNLRNGCKAKRWAKDTIAYNNSRWGVELGVEEYHKIYTHLCYKGTIHKAVDFMRNGFDMDSLVNYSIFQPIQLAERREQ